MVFVDRTDITKMPQWHQIVFIGIIAVLKIKPSAVARTSSVQGCEVKIRVAVPWSPGFSPVFRLKVTPTPGTF